MAKIELSYRRDLDSETRGVLRPPKKPKSLIALVSDVVGITHFIAANSLLILIKEGQAREIMYSQNIFESTPLIELVLRFLDWPVYSLYLKFFSLPKEIAPKYMVAEGIIILSSILYAFLVMGILKLLSLPLKNR